MFNYNTNFYSVAILIAIAIYHLMIFLGRYRYKIKEERYNIYFVIYALSIAFYIYINSLVINDYKISIHERRLLLSLLNIGILFGLINSLCAILEFKIKKLFILNYLLLIPQIIFALIIIIFPFNLQTTNKFLRLIFYNLSKINFDVVLITSIDFIFVLIIFLIFVIKKKLYLSINTFIIFIGFFITTSYLVFQNLLVIFMPYGFLVPYNSYMSSNYFFIGIVAYIFVYALAKKFNNEYKDLLDLKESLEQKVELRTEELMRAKEEIELVSKQKIIFFINLAHEMKTPLTLINNYVSKYIEKKGLNNEMLVIKQNIEKLTRDMINFLDSEKLERGDFFYNNDLITNFSELLNKKLELFKGSVSKKNIKLICNVQENIFIKADPNALDRIFDNLLINALKFTDQGGQISIKLGLEKEKIIFTVTDTGIGITEEDQNNIFKPFYQINNKKSTTQGVGIGLSIVKKIVDSLKGEIKLTSKENQQTTFQIILDKYNLKSEDIIEDKEEHTFEYIPITLEPKDSTYDPNKKNIFIVEDNVELLYYLQNELDSIYNVYVSKNGKMALQKINQIPKPDIIISDVMMAEMDGYEFFENILKINCLESVPFIFLTAKVTLDEKIRGLAKGAIDYIYKPFSIEELKLKIDSILKQVKKQRDINMKEAMNAIADRINSKNRDQKNNNDILNFESKYKNYQITKREKEIILLIYNGFEHKEIGSKLNISTSTVIRHVQNVYEKLNVHNKIELINLLFKS